MGEIDTYSCLTDGAFSEFIEIYEEFSDPNSVFGHSGLESLFNVKLHVHVRGLFLLGRGMETVHHRNS